MQAGQPSKCECFWRVKKASLVTHVHHEKHQKSIRINDVYPQITKRPGYLGSSWVRHVYFVASFFNQPATKCNQPPVLAAAPWHALHRWPRPPPSWPPPHEAPTWPSYRRCLGPGSSMDHGDGLINKPAIKKGW